MYGEEEAFEQQLILWALALLIDQGDMLMASVQDIQAQLDSLSGLLDQVATQEAGETTVDPGKVQVAQADLDALGQKVADVTTHAQGLIDAAPAPTPAPASGAAPADGTQPTAGGGDVTTGTVNPNAPAA